MDDETLEIFTKISESIVKDNWKTALDSLFVMLRKKFVFDNLAIYLVEATGTCQKPFTPVRLVGAGARRPRPPGVRKLPTRLWLQVKLSSRPPLAPLH